MILSDSGTGADSVGGKEPGEPGVLLRAARESDSDAVAALETACFFDPWSLESVRGQITDALSLTLVAEENDGIVGYVAAMVLIPECEILRIAVLPACRRRGLGRTLLGAALAAMRERGGGTVLLEVRASNNAARSLYRQAGFREAGFRKQYYRRPSEDAAILVKDLIC